MTAPAPLTLAATGTTTTAGTSHSVSLPSGTADKVIFFLAFESGGTTAPGASATGWTVAKSYAISQSQVLYVLTRAATSETSVSVATAESSYAAWVGGSTDGDIANAVFSTGATGSGSTNDPDEVTVPSGDYRGVAMVAYQNGSRAINSYPTNYDDNQSNPRIAGSSRPGLGLATRGLAGITSEDPGAFGMHGGSGSNIAATMAIPEASGGLSAPGSPSATPDSTSQITVDWTDTNTAETGYRVERSPAGEGSWVDVSGNLAADTETYADTGLDAGTSYDYRIFAFDGSGDGPASTTVTARTTSEQIGTLPLAAVIGQYDSRDLPGSDTDPVDSWADVGPDGQDPLAQATAAKQPVLEDHDSLRWVKFDGSDDLLVNSLDQTYTGDFAIIAVLEPLTYPTGSASVLYSTGFVNGTTEKNILGIDDVESGWPNGAWVVMSGDGSQAEHYHGTDLTLDAVIPGTRFVMTQLVRNAGEQKVWENTTLVIDEADAGNGDNLNDMPGMFLGAREDETRHMNARVGFLLLVDMSQATEAQLLSARDTLINDFDVGTFATPDTVAATVSLPTPTPTAPVTVTPATISAVAAVPTPAVAVGKTVTPDAVAATTAAPTPGAQGEAATSPAAVAASAAVPAPTLEVPASVSPATIGAVVAVPTPDLSVGQTVNPATVALLTTVGAVTVSGAADVSPAVVAASVALPTPTAVVQDDDVTVQPSVIAVPVEVLGPTASIPGSASPAVTAATVALQTPVASIPGDVTPLAVDAVVAIPSPSVVHGFTVTPATVLISMALPTPTVLGASFPIVARQRGRFYRLSGRLVLVPLGRSIKTGWGKSEGWEQVSSVFVYDQGTGRGDHESAMGAVASAWGTHSGSDTATLKSAIDDALQAYGFRGVDGSDIT